MFYLKSTNKILANRLFNSRADRPLISRIDNIESMLEFVSKHMFERSNFYEMAHYKINTVNKGIEQISNQIKSLFTDYSFKITFFNNYINSLIDCC